MNNHLAYGTISKNCDSWWSILLLPQGDPWELRIIYLLKNHHSIQNCITNIFLIISYKVLVLVEKKYADFMTIYMISVTFLDCFKINEIQLWPKKVPFEHPLSLRLNSCLICSAHGCSFRKQLTLRNGPLLIFFGI